MITWAPDRYEHLHKIWRQLYFSIMTWKRTDGYVYWWLFTMELLVRSVRSGSVMEGVLLIFSCRYLHGHLARYAKFRVAHAPGMPGTFSPSPRISDPDMRHGTCGTHVPWCVSGSLTSGLLWSLWWGKRSWHSQRMRNPQFYISAKWPIQISLHEITRKSGIFCL